MLFSFFKIQEMFIVTQKGWNNVSLRPKHRNSASSWQHNRTQHDISYSFLYFSCRLSCFSLWAFVFPSLFASPADLVLFGTLKGITGSCFHPGASFNTDSQKREVIRVSGPPERQLADTRKPNCVPRGFPPGWIWSFWSRVESCLFHHRESNETYSSGSSMFLWRHEEL